MNDFIINLIPIKRFREKFKRIAAEKKRLIWEHTGSAEFAREKYIKPLINNQFEKFDIQPKKDLETDKIIWQYWGQGISDETPKIVKKCLESVEKHKGQYQVIFLTNENIKEYLDIPDFVTNKLNNNPEFTVTLFSDLLRLILLNTYGGIWIDATIYLTDEISKKYTEQDFFVFQRTPKPVFSARWVNYNRGYFNWEKYHKVNMLNSFMVSKKHYPLTEILQTLLLNYWKNEDKIQHYFFTQILFNELMEYDEYNKYNCKKVSDLIPHEMQLNMYKPYTQKLWNNLTKSNSIHKLTYWLKPIPQNSILDKILND